MHSARRAPAADPVLPAKPKTAKAGPGPDAAKTAPAPRLRKKADVRAPKEQVDRGGQPDPRLVRPAPLSRRPALVASDPGERIQRESRKERRKRLHAQRTARALLAKYKKEGLKGKPYGAAEFKPASIDYANALLAAGKKAALAQKFHLAFQFAQFVAASKHTDREDVLRDFAILFSSNGRVSFAFQVVQQLKDEKTKAVVFRAFLNHPGKLSLDQLKQVLNLVGSQTPLENHPIYQWFQRNDLKEFEKLNRTQQFLMVYSLMQRYHSHSALPSVLETVILRLAGLRHKLWKVAQHNPLMASLLLKAVGREKLSPDYFWPDKKQKSAIAWSHTFRQYHYLREMQGRAKAKGIRLAVPRKISGSIIRNWVQRNTEKLTQVFRKEHNGDGAKMSKEYKRLMEMLFSSVSAGITPTLSGSVRHLKSGGVARTQLLIDCDMYTAYATRLFRNSGMKVLGFMAIEIYKENGKVDGNMSHAASLLRDAGGKYFFQDNQELKPLNLPKKASQASAKAAFLKAMEDYYKLHKKYKLYFAPATSRGGIPRQFLYGTNPNWLIGKKGF